MSTEDGNEEKVKHPHNDTDKLKKVH